jgi:transcriptional regulator with GAF, ATPase, and Fis domain/tetratricopeptide (TPR) repeat protein
VLREANTNSELFDSRYRIIRTLGRGGMGTVLLAQDLTVEDGMPTIDENSPFFRGLALKVLDSEQLLGAFLDAFQLHRGLAHPAFAQALGLAMDSHGDRYAVMEWCRGAPLAAGGLADEGTAAKVGRAILDGLDHLHRHGLAHGDLSTDNVLVEFGDSVRLKILDLGASGAIGTGAGSVSGVLTHLAPERLTGAGLSVQGDLFAVGVLLFVALEGQHPYGAYPRVIPDDTSKLRFLKAPTLGPWLTRLIHPDSRQRYPDAMAAMEALSLLFPDSGSNASESLETLPFIDVGGTRRELQAKLRRAHQGEESLTLEHNSAPGRGRSRLLTELMNVLGTLGIRGVAGRVLPSDRPGDLMVRLGQRLGLIPPEGRRVHSLGLARLIVQRARDSAFPVAFVIDDAEHADPVTARGLRFLRDSVMDAPREARHTIVITTGDDADTSVDLWRHEDLHLLIEALFPNRRISRGDVEGLLEHCGGRIAELAPRLQHLLREGAFETSSASVNLRKGWLSAIERLPLEDARVERLNEAELRLLGRLAYARAPVPRTLIEGPLSGLVFQGCVAQVDGDLGPAVTIISQSWLRAGRRALDSTQSHEYWRKIWSDETGGRAVAERLWVELQLGRSGARDAARAFLMTVDGHHGVHLVSEVLDEDWPLTGDSATIGDLAQRAQDDGLAQALYERGALGGDVQAALRLASVHTAQSRHADALELLESVETERPEDVVRLAAARARSAVLTGRLEDAELHLSQGRALDLTPLLRAHLGNTAGLIHFYRGDLTFAQTELTEALTHARSAGEPREQAAILTAIGLIDFRRGALGRARDRYEEALTMGEEDGDQSRVLTSLQNIAVVHHEEGAYREALDTYQEALSLAESLEQTGRVVQLCGNLGNLYRYLGDLSAAVSVIERGLRLAREEDNRYMIGLLLVLLGDVHLANELWELAQEALTEAVEVTVASESATEEVDARLGLTHLHLEIRAYGRAREEAARALAAAQTAELRGHEAQAFALLAASHGESIHGSDELSDRSMRDALARMEEVTSPDTQWRIWLEAMRHAQRRGETQNVAKRARATRSALQRLEDAVPAVYRDSFGACRDRRKAWAETLSASINAPGEASASTSESWRRLLEVNKRLTSEHDVKRLLEYVMDSAVLLSGAERGFLLLTRDGRDDLEVRVARNLDRENIQRTKMKISHSIATRVIESGEAVMTLDAMEDDRYREQLSVHDLKLRSVLCLPMIRRGEVLGAIYLDNRFRSSAFGADVLATMEAFADQAAIALANTRLMASMSETQGELREAHESIARLNEALESELEERTLELEDSHQVVIRQREQLTGKHRYEALIGEADSLKRIFHAMDRLLDNTIPVLIEGESGTGKELVARAIHFNGARGSGPFVALNCGAIPATLLESELFGHSRGSFTGATRDKIGVFEAAHGGTLLLDELGELPLQMQAALLRVLQSGEFKRVGETHERQVDVRIIAATNKTLRDEVEGGRFREDLYYRLAAVPLTLPPLRERPGDIRLLVEHFLTSHREQGLSTVTAVHRDALRMLERSPWPGNVRQLEMVLKNAALFADSVVLSPEDFSAFPEITGSGSVSLKGARLSGRTLADIEREAIIQALTDNRGNKKRSAEKLGIDRRTLYNKLKSYNITVENELRVG